MTEKKAVVISQFKFDADPRHRYWSNSLQNMGYQVTEVELLQIPGRGLKPVEVTRRANRISIFHWSDRNRYLKSPQGRHRGLYEAPYETAIGRYLEKTLTSCTLSLHLVREHLRESDVLVANDLIPAVACVFSGLTAKYSIYDAQEFFTSSYDVIGIRGLSTSEKAVWDSRESVVAIEFSKRISISIEGCQLMKERLGQEFEVIPNCIPQSRLAEALDVSVKIQTKPYRKGPVRFVFLGRAEPNRGLEQLIQAWEFLPEVATLSLVMPESAHKQRLMRSTQKERKSRSILFPSQIPNSQVISELSRYDVGIVPYLYRGDYAYATPTKFGEYVAAGLPTIVSSSCQSLGRIVLENKIGKVTDFRDPESIRHSLGEMNSEIFSSDLVRNVLRFREVYVWERFFGQAIDQALKSTSLPQNSADRQHVGAIVERPIDEAVATGTTWYPGPFTTIKKVRARGSILQLTLVLYLIRRISFVPRLLSRL